MINQFVYKILAPRDYQAAKALGHPRTELDVGDGYVHLSTSVQVGETLALHYKDVEGVYLLEFAVADLEIMPGALRWELSRGGQLFPHLYADLKIAWTKRQWILPLDEAGVPQVPGDLKR